MSVYDFLRSSTERGPAEKMVAILRQAWDAYELTREERLALLCLSFGMRPERSGELLRMHPDAVRLCLSSAMKKLGAYTGVHAMAQAIRAGLIP